MTRRTAWILGALGLLAAMMAVEWAALRDYYSPSAAASIECRAVNAGTRVTAEDVRVLVYPTGQPWNLVAEGHSGVPLAVPPGTYDVRLLLVASADQQSEWFREVEVDTGEQVVREAVFDAGELHVEHPTSNGSLAGQLVVYVFLPENHNEIITSIRSGDSAVLAAGTYDLRAVLSRESEERGVTWLRGVEVDAGGVANPEIPFHRGRLLVTARNAGEILPNEAVTMTVFAAGDSQEEVIDWGRAGTPMSLEQGRYDVELTFALSNDRASRWLRGLEIVQGETLEQTVEFASGSVLVDAVLTGGEALREFEVYVYYYKAGDHREPVSYTPAGEAAVLESALYDVRIHFFRSHDQPDAWLRDVAVEAGKRVSYTAAFPSGRLLVRAYDADRRELIGDDVFLYVHGVRAPGTRSHPIALARSGEELILTAGKYDVRLVDTRAPDRARWLRGVAVEAGERSEHSVSLDTAPRDQRATEPSP
jgi:hypothetical protein